MLTNKKGFTMIELVLVITILGLLAVAALPVFKDMTGKAKDAAMAGVVGAVRSGINVIYLDNLVNGVAASAAWPPALDDAAGTATACRSNNDCFGIVLQGGITDSKWSRSVAATGPWNYALGGTPAVCQYTYNPLTGIFASTSGPNCP